VAFLGWSPPGSETGHFGAIPASAWPAPHQTETVRCETRDGPLTSFEPQIVDSIWPDVRNEGQYTRVRFEPENAADFPAGTQFEWDFGDGQTASGARVEHVYLRPERYQVSLTANGTAGDGSASWPLLIYELQHVTGEIKQGRPPDYAEIATAYDTTKLDADNLLELARLFSESDRPADAIRAGRSFVERFGQSGSASLPDVHRLIAFSALKTGEQGVDDAIRSFEASITDETPAAAKIDSYAQLIRLLGIEKSEPEKALALLPVVEQTARKSVVDDEVKAAYRRAVNASGDTALWNGHRAQARDYYRRVEALRGKYIPLQVRAARIGAYPTSLREHLAAGNFGAALNLVNEWEDTFATDKVNGHTFFWRGAILALRKQHREAARYLARAIALAIGAPFETEARWRLAVALEGIGKTKESQAELARLVATGLADDFTDLARRKLKALAEAGSP
jgi:PKD repeat protein